jgi:hypothetical protein
MFADPGRLGWCKKKQELKSHEVYNYFIFKKTSVNLKKAFVLTVHVVVCILVPLVDVVE